MNNQIKIVVLVIISVIAGAFTCYLAIRGVVNPKAKMSPQTRITCGLIRIGGKINPENAEVIIKKILEFSANQEIQGVMLVINSMGGESGITELIFREVLYLSKLKPVVGFVINMCCSGAYKIVAATDWIIAPSASTIGSIGTSLIIERYKHSRINSNGHMADVDYEVIHAGKFKTLNYSESAPLSEEQRAFLQSGVEASYKIFYTAVAEGRNLSLDSITDWADGKVFNGDQALEKGLIDEVGGYTDAINALLKLIKDRDVNFKMGKLFFIE